MMKGTKLGNLIILVLILVDATGDTFRWQGLQLIHHSAESAYIMIWFALWAFLRFNPVYIAMYILSRIWAFDLMVNLLKGIHPLYMGESDLFGRAVRWFADLVKQNYYHFSFMLKFLALVVWAAWFWTDKKFREIKLSAN